MRFYQLIGLGLLAILVNSVNGDYYTSVVGLDALIEFESKILESFEHFLQEVEITNNKIKNFLNEVEKKNQIMAEDPEYYYGDPLNAFQAIRRMVVDWKDIERDILISKELDGFDKNITLWEAEGYVKPTADDLTGACSGLARLQHTYALDTEDLVKGILVDTKESDPLSASDCYYMGQMLYDLKEYSYSVEWLILARNLLAKEHLTLNNTVVFPYNTQTQILEYLGPALFNIGNTKMASKLNDELLTIDPNNKYALENKQLFRKRVIEERRTKSDVPRNSTKTLPKSEVTDLYEQVCREELFQTPSEQRHLRCRYVTNNVPFCLIAPFRMEELSHDPFVAYYHAVIYDSEIDEIISRTEDTVERSKVGDSKSAKFSEVRTSKNAWLWYHEHSFLNNIAQRLRDMTGLTTDTAEALQVANYGIGGHYGPHFDFSETNNTYGGKGNRILTALFYINEVEMGGATAFPFLRLAVPPVRGSMVLWFNLHESLELDYRTKHAGCPVLKGVKWICNEWFHQLGQEFLRPCSLNLQGNVSIEYKTKV